MSRSGRTTLSLSSPQKSDAKTKLHAQDLRQVLSDRMVEFQHVQSEWLSEKEHLQSQCERFASELRSLDLQAAAEWDSDKKKHLIALAEMKEHHKNTVLELQAKIQDTLNADDSKVDDELNQEIAALREEIASLDDESHEPEDIELVDADADDRLQRLRDQLDDLQQMHDDAIHQKEEQSQDHTHRIEQLVLKQQTHEEDHVERVAGLIEVLNQLDLERREKIGEIHQEIADERLRVLTSVKGASFKMQALQQNVAKKQREHSRMMRELQDKADRLRTALEAKTARQQQQMTEAKVCAGKIADEKKKFTAMSREFQMLNTERVREAVDHGALMRELSKMDSYILAQMSAGTAGTGGSWSTVRSKRSGVD
jgi:DNA repair exonuclease SbcCD ATPase subunit